MKNFVELHNVSRFFGEQKVLEGVDLSFGKKGFYGLVGASGSGKSTLLNILSGIDVSYSGECLIAGHSLKRLSEKRRNAFRLQNMGYIFQSYELLGLESVLENVTLPINATSQASSRLKKRKALDLLSFVKMEDKAKQGVDSLSGGEKQRVCFARSLINDPAILLCDEPSGALDEKNALECFSLLKAISKTRLVIVVSHDQKLVESFADVIYLVNDGVVSKKENEIEESFKKMVSSPRLGERKSHPRLPLFFLLGHAKRLMKKKKIRSLLSVSAISLGLLGLGLTVYVSNSIQGELEGAFSSLVNKNTIYMSPMNPTGNPISSYYSAKEDSVKRITNDYHSEVQDYGVSYLVNFEQFYQDKNIVYVPHGLKQIVLPSFSIRSVNDYQWIEEKTDNHFFPSLPKVIEDDQVVLSLTYQDMVNLCFGLQILRNYESLGNYIKAHGLRLVFSLANYSWTYEDEQTVSVVSVTSGQTAGFYHPNHRWSTYFFETKMRFPSSDHQDDSLPWIMNKVFYLKPRKTLSEMLGKLRKDERFSSYVFERPSSSYDATHCPIGEQCSLERVYVYIADKNSVPYSSIKKATELCSHIQSHVITTSASYWSLQGGLLSGFAQKFFIGTNQNDLDMVVDSYSDVKKEEANLDFALPNGVFDGSYLKSRAGGFYFSSDLSKMASGAPPVGVEEVALSKSLYEKMCEPKEISVSASVGEKIEGEMLRRSFSSALLKVTGVVEADGDGLFAAEDWTIDFFLEGLGMSAFYLEPTGALFSLDSSMNMKESLSLLAKEMPTYRFVDPSSAISESIKTTTSYIEGILMIFTVVSLIISALLFYVVMAVSVQENQGEARLLFVLGLNRHDIASTFNAEAFCLGGLSCLISVLSLSFSQYAVHLYIGESFGASSAFTFSLAPVLTVFIFFLLSFFLMALAIKILVHRMSF